MKLIITIVAMFFMMSLGNAQNAKQFYKTGEKFEAAGEFKSAIEQYTLAVNLDPAYSDAYLSRAKCYQQNKQLQEALDDYGRFKALDAKETSFYYDAALICYQLEKYPEALEYVNSVTLNKKTKLEGFTLLSKIQIAQEKYSEALLSANTAIALSDLPELHFLKAKAYDKTNDFDNAEKEYYVAISKDPKYVEALIALSTLQIKMQKYDKALENTNKVIAIDDKNKEAYILRSSVYVKMLDYPKAIDDMSRTIMLNPDDKEMYFLRGTYYLDFTQHQNAINDFNKVLLIDDKYAEAYYKRAYSYEQIANYPKAIADYTKLNTLSAYDGKAQALLDQANKRLFELNRESNKPQIVVTEPAPDKDQRVKIPINKTDANILGMILDESNIASIQVNKVNVPFVKNEKNNEFIAKISTVDIDSFIIVATDVYDNKQELTYHITRTEINAPTVALLSPYASDNGEVFLEQDSPSLYIEGTIADESLINSIFIDGVLASYKVDELNPAFMATVSIANKSTFTVSVKDIYGNQTDKAFIINREGISLLASNPMGRTWAVFIENSDYDNFPSLDGPARDVSLMRSALAGYDIHNIIHKKNMNKKDLERFFAIDLRDIIRSNGVRSVLVWYAGHGKFINETGYWIPTDAQREDEFSYYSINSLKASLQSYNTLLNHTLLITDACESGPTFYQAMRGDATERNCGDWEATKLKSSQVFTSAGYELAVDNSQFTKTFANMLANNPNTCIPIESIVSKVTQAVSQSNQQKPQFGKISGLTDEDGTFFFINKK